MWLGYQQFASPLPLANLDLLSRNLYTTGGRSDDGTDLEDASVVGACACACGAGERLAYAAGLLPVGAQLRLHGDDRAAPGQRLPQRRRGTPLEHAQM